MPLGPPPPRPPSSSIRYLHHIGRSDPIASHIFSGCITFCTSFFNRIPFRLHILQRSPRTSIAFDLLGDCSTAVMAMATGAGELAAAFASAVVVKSPWQQGQALKVQGSPGGASSRRFTAVLAQRRMVEEESAVSPKRSSLLSTAMALAGAAMVAGAVAGCAEAAIQKVEGTEREEQDAVTTGIRQPSRFSAAESNSIQEAAKINTQASGGLILGAPKLDEPAGAYRSPQSSTYGVDEAGGKRSTPAGILQGRSEGKSGSGGSEPAVIGGDARE